MMEDPPDQEVIGAGPNPLIGNDEPASEPPHSATKKQYEDAMLYVYDKAESSEHWLILRTVKGMAGAKWLDVCLTAAASLERNESFELAFRKGMDRWGVDPTRPQIIKGET